MTLRAISRTRPAPQTLVWQSRFAALQAALKHTWSIYWAWRLERAAIRQLNSLSDRQLKDIGLDRSEITGAVRNGAHRRPRFPYY
jgi:uncharacterized protein YjiS (DUF1127 family)